MNTIIGDGDQGKSTIIRALAWVMRNESPSTWWNLEAAAANENAIVGLVLEHPTDPSLEIKVIRERGKTKNQYRLYEPGDEESQDFTGFGTEVPGKILRILGHEPIQFAKGVTFDLNFSGQHDDPFLMKSTSASPRQLAQIFGKLTGIDVIDQAENLGQKEVKSLKGKSKTLTGEQERLTGEVAAFPDLESAEQQIVEITSLRESIDTTTERIENIEVTKNRLQGLFKVQTAAESIFGALELSIEPARLSIECLRTHYRRLSGITREVENLRGQRVRLAETERQFSALRGIPELIEQANTSGDKLVKIRGLTEHVRGLRKEKNELAKAERQSSALKEVPELTEKFIKCIEINEKISRVSGIIGRIRHRESDLEAFFTTLADAEKEIEIITLEFATIIETTEICPLSGGTLFANCKELLKRV